MEAKYVNANDLRALTLDELRAVAGGHKKKNDPAKKAHEAAQNMGKLKPQAGRPSGCGKHANC